MSLSCRLSRVGSLLMIIHLAAWPGIGHAQGRPSGNSPRLWLELGVSAAAQEHRCTTCIGSATIGGGSATATAGVTLPQGFGIGILGRAFNQFSYESSLQSRYLIALAQYAPPAVSLLTLNAGVGQGRNFSNAFSDEIEGTGTVFYAGTSLRIPPRSGFAMSLTADVTQAIDGTPRSHPRLLSLGVSFAVATPAPTPHAP